MFLLDTNVISELRKANAGSANRGVAEWADRTPATFMYLSAISLHELEYGVQLAERADPEKGALLRAWLHTSVVPAFSGRIVPVDDQVARRAAALHIPDPAPFRDGLIGASAIVHSMTMVTRNTADFSRFDELQVLNPWT